MAGKVAANPGANVQIAAGLSLFFLEAGSSNWLDLGALSGASFEPSTEFLDYSQNRRGSNALTRRFLQNKGFIFNAALDEVTPENLRLAFLGGDISAGADPTYARDTATLTVGSDTNKTVTLPETAAAIDRVILSTDFQGTDLTFDFTGPAATLSITDGSISGGEQVTVFYRVNVGGSGSNIKKFTIGSNSIISGQAAIQLRMQGGGIGRIFEIPDCEIAPNGSIDISPDAVEAFPITVTCREVNGNFGTVHMFDVAS